MSISGDYVQIVRDTSYRNGYALVDASRIQRDQDYHATLTECPFSQVVFQRIGVHA